MHSIAERHKYILESLNKNGFIKVSNIANDLNVTSVTIRKDLKSLEEKKLLSRTHGSASSSVPLTSDIDVHLKEKNKKGRKDKNCNCRLQTNRRERLNNDGIRINGIYICRTNKAHKSFEYCYSIP